MGTVTDHVAPWKSVYKLQLLTHAELTFCLTTGGHNVGVVNPPSPESKRKYKLHTRKAGSDYLDPQAFVDTVRDSPGSWWPAWEGWLCAKSSGKVAPPKPGGSAFKPVGEAPGKYVFMR